MHIDVACAHAVDQRGALFQKNEHHSTVSFVALECGCCSPRAQPSLRLDRVQCVLRKQQLRSARPCASLQAALVRTDAPTNAILACSASGTGVSTIGRMHSLRSWYQYFSEVAQVTVRLICAHLRPAHVEQTQNELFSTNNFNYRYAAGACECLATQQKEYQKRTLQVQEGSAGDDFRDGAVVQFD